MRKLLPLFLVLFLPFAACGDDTLSPPDPTEAAVGTYTLVQVFGRTLPALLGNSGGGYPLYVTSGTLTLRSVKSYTETVNSQITRPASEGGVQTSSRTENGTFAVVGTTVQFRRSDLNGDVRSGTLIGNTLSFDADIGATYQKQ